MSTQSDLAELYTTFFNRAPDATGLTYWVNEISTGKLTLAQVAKNWTTQQAEGLASLPSTLTNTQFIDKIYANILGRTADTTGATYWLNQLNSGAVTRDTFALSVINGAKANTTAQGVLDTTLINNKATVGVAFANKGVNDTTLAAKVLTSVTANADTLASTLAVISLLPATTASQTPAILASANAVLTKFAALITAAPAEVADAATYLKALVAGVSSTTNIGTLLDNANTLLTSAATNSAALDNPAAQGAAAVVTATPSTGGGGTTPVVNTINATATAETPTLTNGADKFATKFGTNGTPEKQEISFSSASVAVGQTVTVSDGTNTLTYTNNTAGTLTGTALAAAVATQTLPGFTVAVDGTISTIVNFTQNATPSDIAVLTVAGTGITQANPGTAEKQAINFTSVTVAVGETVTVGDGTNTLTYTNASGGSLTGAPLAAAIAGQTFTGFAVAVDGTTPAQVNFTKTGVTSDIALLNIGGNGITQASAGTAEKQGVNFAGITVNNLETVTVGDGTNTLTYTNNTGSPVTGAALATAISAEAFTGFTVAIDGTTTTKVVFTKSGTPSDIPLLTVGGTATLAGLAATEDTKGVPPATAEAVVIEVTKGVTAVIAEAFAAESIKGVPGLDSTSKVTALDTLTGFAVGTDKVHLLNNLGVDVAVPVSLTRVADVATSNDLAGALSTAFTSLTANQAGLVVISAGSAAGTYLYADNGNGNVDASADVFIKLVGVTPGAVGGLAVSDYFV